MSHLEVATESPTFGVRDVDRKIDEIARKLVELRFDAAAIFFLEAHLPFSTIFHTAGLLFEPIALPFFGVERIRTFQSIFCDRKKIEQLMRRMEVVREEKCTKGAS